MNETNEIDAWGAMDSTEMRRRINGAAVARLATVGRDGRPHIVPITFALDDDTIYFAVDFKPKKTPDLQRLRNIETNPSVSVLVDHYEEDWTKLWWVRADGSARVVIEGAGFEKGIALLSQRYAQYRSAPPAGPVVPIAIERMTGWSAS
jgi:PPOX class probable F420-dependent enzyme